MAFRRELGPGLRLPNSILTLSMFNTFQGKIPFKLLE